MPPSPFLLTDTPTLREQMVWTPEGIVLETYTPWRDLPTAIGYEAKGPGWTLTHTHLIPWAQVPGLVAWVQAVGKAQARAVWETEQTEKNA